jgi:hypothetical protein
MNVKFWKILDRLWVIDVLRHVRTAPGGEVPLCSAVRYNVLKVGADIFEYPFFYIYNPALQGNWPHSHYLSLLYTWRLVPGS